MAEGTPSDSTLNEGTSGEGTPAGSMPEDIRSGERPRPQYGEYASPEQQAKAMGTAKPAKTPITVTAAPPTAAFGTHPPTGQPSPPPRAYGQNLPGVRTAETPRRWDLTVSAILLAYGLYSVITGFFQYRDLGAVIDKVYATQGVAGSFAASDLSNILGIVINVSDVILFLATLLITFAVLRRGKVAFYIPLIGGAIAGIVAAVCVLALVLGDPSFLAFVNGSK